MIKSGQINTIDFYIKLKRKDLMFQSNNREDNKYLCTLEFYNKLNTHLITLNLSEKDIILFLEEAYEFIEFNNNYTNITFNNILSNYNSNSIRLEYDIHNPDIYYIIISEYNKITGYHIDRIKLLFIDDTKKYSFFDFIVDIYYFFIEDIGEQYPYLVPDFITGEY